MVAHPAVVGRMHPLESLVGDSEEGVAAEHGLEHIAGMLLTPVDEVLVLLDELERVSSPSRSLIS